MRAIGDKKQKAWNQLMAEEITQGMEEKMK